MVTDSQESPDAEYVVSSVTQMMDKSSAASPLITVGSSSESMRTIRAWVEFLARPCLFTVTNDPMASSADSPIGSYAALLHHLRLVIQNASALTLGSTRSLAKVIRSEMNLESANNVTHQQTVLLEKVMLSLKKKML